jgi:hypothetical protein
LPQLRSRLPSPLGPRRAGASRQRAPGPPGRVYKPPRPPASERASERARRELCPRGKGSAPCSGRIPTLCVSLAAQTQRARHGGESGSQGPPDCLPACLPLARGEAAPPPASQPASQPASVFSLRVCVPRKRPPDWASPELSSRAETCVWMWCGGWGGGLPSVRLGSVAEPQRRGTSRPLSGARRAVLCAPACLEAQ